jgi:ABC-type proline/glycine betaine transport system ATPase subunit
VGDHVYLKVSPTKGVQRFGIKGKLAPRYIGPYEIREACGPVAYQLELPPHMSAVHNVFHVSQLLGTCSQMLGIKNKATQEMLGVKVLRPP